MKNKRVWKRKRKSVAWIPAGWTGTVRAILETLSLLGKGFVALFLLALKSLVRLMRGGEGEQQTRENARSRRLSLRNATRSAATKRPRRNARSRALRIEPLEVKALMAGLFETVDPKVSDAFSQYQTKIEGLYSSSAAAEVRTVFSQAYSAAQAAGPLANPLTGGGALATAHQNYFSDWQASDSLLTDPTASQPNSIELAFQNLGKLEDTAAQKTLSSPTTQFSAGMAGLCWAVDGISLVAAPPAAVVLTPWCAGLTDAALLSFGKDYAVNFVSEASQQAIDNLGLSPAVTYSAHRLVETVNAGYDLYEFRHDLLDAKRFVNAPDILEPLYHNANATASFVGWTEGLRDFAKDSFRANDAFTTEFVDACMESEGLRFEMHRIGDVVLNIASQRPLTSGEKSAVAAFFMDPNFSTTFIGFNPTQSQQLLSAVGVLDVHVRLQDGRAVILGTDGPDTIDVYSPVDGTGQVEIRMNNDPLVVLPRSAMPQGVEVYGRGDADHVSIRFDMPSLVSGGAGDDVLIGGWGPDVIKGGPGNDNIQGRDGNDVLDGNAGDDQISGGAGDNVIHGGTGTDVITDNHQLVTVSQVMQAQDLAPAATSVVPTLRNVTTSPNPANADGQVTFSAVDADGNGGGMERFEVWEAGAGGRMLGVDYTAFDGFNVILDAATLGSVGTHKTISHIVGTNGVASNWVAKDVIVSAPPLQATTISNVICTPNPVLQGQTETFQVYVNDPNNLVNFVQVIRDVDNSGNFNTGDSVLGNATRSGNTFTFTLLIDLNYDIKVHHFIFRARFDNNAQWTAEVSRAVEVDPPANSAATVVALVASNPTLVRGLSEGLTAQVVAGARPVTEVHWWRDSNNNGVLDIVNTGQGADLEVGIDTNGSNGWFKSVGTGSFPLGWSRFFVRAEDGIQASNVVSTLVYLTPPDSQAPQASLLPTVSVSATGGAAYGYQVCYTDDVAINSYYLGDGNTRVVGPNDYFSQSGRFVNVDNPGDGTPLTATYAITPPGGSWSFDDNGTYRIYVVQNQISDTSANFIPYTLLGTFSVNIPDDTPPVIALNDLSNDVNHPTVFNTSNVAVTGTATDNESGIVAGKFHFFLTAFRNGVWQEPQDNGASSASAAYSNLADGLYSVMLQGQNGAGLTAFSPSGFFRVATNIPPAVPSDTNTLANSIPEGAINGTTVGITAVSSDPNGDTVTYSLADDAGGRFGIDPGTGVVTVADSTLLDFESATSHTIVVQASDGAGGISTASFAIAVTNVNPTTPSDANAASNSVAEGATNGTITGVTAAATDPNGPKVTYKLTNDAAGRFAINATTGVVTVADSTLLDGPTTYAITVQATDGAGGSSQAMFNIAVANVAPTASLSGPASGVRGQLRSFIFGASDPSPVDQSASFSYAISWGDGSTQTIVGTANQQVDHIFVATGNFPVRFTATDKNGGASSAVQQSITIKAVDLQGSVLAVGLTTADDSCILKPNDGLGNVLVMVNGVSQGTFHPTAEILVFGQAGNDSIQLASNKIKGQTYYIVVNAVLYGDGGNDTIDARGSTGNNVLVGGDGIDNLQGGAGREFLLGGAGTDILRASGGDDVLIGNITSFETNLAALNALLAEWGRTDVDYTTRSNHLLGITSGGLNGNVLLNSTTIRDDAAIDQLYGEAGLDLFFYTSNGTYKDKLNDRIAGELAASQ